MQPKKPLSAFMFYASANRKHVSEENPDLSFGDITKVSPGMLNTDRRRDTPISSPHYLMFCFQLVSAKFKKLSAEERAIWEEKAKNE